MRCSGPPVASPEAACIRVCTWSTIFGVSTRPALKYAAHHRALAECPPASCKPISHELYRFVHADIHDRRNFLPPRLLSPRRTFDSAEACCSAYALSMFTSEADAVARYRSLVGPRRQLHQQLGTHLAQGPVSAVDGIATPPTRGHLDLHESTSAVLQSKFAIVRQLYPLPA